MLQLYHYSPRQPDTVLSAEIYDDFIRMLDPMKIVFTNRDLDQLQSYKFKLCSLIEKNDSVFLKTVSPLYRNCLLRSDTIIRSLIKTPFILSEKDSIELPADSINYPATVKDLKLQIRKWLKYFTLERLAEMKFNDSSFTDKTLLLKEPEVQKKSGKSFLRKITRLLNVPSGFDQQLVSLFCNAIAGCFDPHSEYFSLNDQENFEGALGSDYYSFGFILGQEKSGDIFIDHLIPGSPAWKSGKMEKEDVLLSMKWENKTPVDLEGADITEAYSMMGEANHDSLTVELQKKDGTIQSIVLVKEKIKNEDNRSKAFILNSKRKIGYITIRDFYTSQADSGRSAYDIADEITKLTRDGKQKVDGIIFDLRFNGGGNMKEANDLASLFLNEGIIYSIKWRGGQPENIFDNTKRAVYNGPLLVLINSQSASASEVVASALQDNKRALIAGSRSFGKATSQVVLPVDTLFNPFTDTTVTDTQKKNGYIKLTVEKIYRPTGKSNQGRGVYPDLVIPDLYDADVYRESSFKHRLAADSLYKYKFTATPAYLPVSEMQNRSNERVKTDTIYKVINHVVKEMRLNDFSDRRKVSLEWNDFLQDEKEITLYHAFVDSVSEAQRSFTIENSFLDLDEFSKKPFLEEINNDWKEYLSKDFYLDEATRIMNDLIDWYEGK